MSIIFPKDIVVIDFETSHGVDSLKTQPVQFAAIRLDRVTLEEKASFTSFIRADMSDAPPEFILKKGYDLDKIAESPTAAETMNKFVSEFGKDYFLSAWVVGGDRELFRGMARAAGMDVYDFDFHYYDIWPLAYTYLLERGYKGSTGSEEMFREFGLPPRGFHDALEDCRMAAEVLRKIVQK